MAEEIKPREPSQKRASPWPFLYSHVAGRGLVINRPQEATQKASKGPRAREELPPQLQGPAKRSWPFKKRKLKRRKSKVKRVALPIGF